MPDAPAPDQPAGGRQPGPQDMLAALVYHVHTEHDGELRLDTELMAGNQAHVAVDFLPDEAGKVWLVVRAKLEPLDQAPEAPETRTS